MKFGICLPGTFKLPDSPAEGDAEQLRALVDGYRFLKETGYDYMEYSVMNLMILSDEDMDKAVEYYKQGLIKVEACNSFIPGTLSLVGDQADTEATRAYLKKACCRMASIGVKIVVFGSGTARRIPEGISRERAQSQLDAFMVMAESIARPLGITIVIEPLNHNETNSLLTVSESAAVVRRLNLPNLKLLADLYHTYVEKEPPQVLLEHKDILRHVHVAAPETRTIPVDHPYLRACGEALREAGYTAGVSIECSCTDFRSEVAGALPVMKSLFHSGESPVPDILQFARPEEAGVRPEWVEDYVNEMNRRGKMCHSFLMLRHGKVFAEGYWKPFHKDWLHRMYSVSKSFVSAAIGMLVDDGKLRLTDKIVDYFPDQLPEKVHPLIAEMTVRDMLMMATCHKVNTYRGDTDMNWLRTFFQPHEEPDHPAGTEFRYDTSGTYTLDVLVERLTGKSFLEFLKDRMLRELGFSENAWCVEAPEGYAWGGSGVECTTRDLARFALVFLNDGYLNGKQYISADYIRQATARQIDNRVNGVVDRMHGHGYGYQVWRTAGNSFSFLGMGGQLALCIPEKDFLFVCNSDTQGDADDYVPIYDVLWDTVIDRMQDMPLPADDDALQHMNQVLNSLEVVVPAGEKTSPSADLINGATYELGENPMEISGFSVEFSGNKGRVVYRTARGEKVFPFGLGYYEDTVFPETHYSGRRINQPLGHGYRCLNTAAWLAENQLLIRTYVIDDYFGNMAAVFTFEEDRVHLSMTKTAEWFLDEYCGEAEGILCTMRK